MLKQLVLIFSITSCSASNDQATQLTEQSPQTSANNPIEKNTEPTFTSVEKRLDVVLETLRTSSETTKLQNILKPLVTQQGDRSAFSPGYNEDILPLVKKHCQMCHAQQPERNWEVYELAEKRSKKMYRATNRPGNDPIMPPSGQETLGKWERETIKAWYEAGARRTRVSGTNFNQSTLSLVNLLMNRIAADKNFLKTLVIELKTIKDKTPISQINLVNAINSLILALDIPEPTPAPELPATGNISPGYEEDILPMFGEAKYNCQMCHSGDSGLFSRWMYNYDIISDKSPTNEFTTTRLSGALLGLPGYTQMPFSGPYLTTEEQDLVKKWIDAGAPKNRTTLN